METPLDKIKKLLRLGESPEKHEAEQALAAAARIAAKHGIDMASCRTDASDITTDSLEVGQRVSYEKKRAMGLVQAFFHVEIVVTGFKGFPLRAVFIGRQEQIPLAMHVYGFLLDQGRAFLRHYQAAETQAKRRNTPRKNRGALSGYYDGIGYRLYLEKQAAESAYTTQQEGLVLDERAARLAVKSARFPGAPKMKVGSGGNTHSHSEGFKSGMATAIHKPVGTSEQPQLTL